MSAIDSSNRPDASSNQAVSPQGVAQADSAARRTPDRAEPAPLRLTDKFLQRVRDGGNTSESFGSNAHFRNLPDSHQIAIWHGYGGHFPREFRVDLPEGGNTADVVRITERFADGRWEPATADSMCRLVRSGVVDPSSVSGEAAQALERRKRDMQFDALMHGDAANNLKQACRARQQEIDGTMAGQDDRHRHHLALLALLREFERGIRRQSPGKQGALWQALYEAVFYRTEDEFTTSRAQGLAPSETCWAAAEIEIFASRPWYRQSPDDELARLAYTIIANRALFAAPQEEAAAQAHEAAAEAARAPRPVPAPLQFAGDSPENADASVPAQQAAVPVDTSLTMGDDPYGDVERGHRLHQRAINARQESRAAQLELHLDILERLVYRIKRHSEAARMQLWPALRNALWYGTAEEADAAIPGRAPEGPPWALPEIDPQKVPHGGQDVVGRLRDLVMEVQCLAVQSELMA
ncbi:MAG TPA: hypothetical protein VHA82_11335 [Ramlibacter sp.]|uniref:hypothetical protein n=1 Tax=Ramlibacter sp. TaxID=1917967 RepID=UPI002CE155D6|nr:hypothetical protein [Ramlibacter sp.]HVZ44394.1 hypothetical protein [Ramlibacter sp.]